jgi:hypothetical protein
MVTTFALSEVLSLHSLDVREALCWHVVTGVRCSSLIQCLPAHAESRDDNESNGGENRAQWQLQRCIPHEFGKSSSVFVCVLSTLGRRLPSIKQNGMDCPCDPRFGDQLTLSLQPLWRMGNLDRAFGASALGHPSTVALASCVEVHTCLRHTTILEKAL